MQTVRHEPKRDEGLRRGYLFDVLTKLLLTLTGTPSSLFGFNDSDDLACRVVKGIVREPVPGLRVVSRDRNFKSDLRSVGEIPLGTLKLRIDQQCSGLGLAHRPRSSLSRSCDRMRARQGFERTDPVPMTSSCRRIRMALMVVRLACHRPSQRGICTVRTRHQCLPQSNLQRRADPIAATDRLN